VDRDFWPDSARTLEPQHVTTARNLAPVMPEDYASHIGDTCFGPLIRKRPDVFARLPSVIRTRGGLAVRSPLDAR
jgi:hypothetical protein